MELNNLFERVKKQYNGLGQNKEEFVPALDLFQSNIKTGNFLEIGTQYGGTFHMLATIHSGKKISVDLPKGIHGGLTSPIVHRRNEGLNAAFKNVHTIVGNSTSQDIINRVEKILDEEKLDLLFIDGDHTYNGVAADYKNYSKFVRPGGQIAFHDILDRPENKKEQVGVPEFWKQLKGEKIEFVCNCSWNPKSTEAIGGIGIIIK